VPLNYWRPNIANKMMMKTRNTDTLSRSGRELIRADTSFLMLGIALILLNGLRALNVLRDFKLKLVATRSNILYKHILML
jgi:hypothetical protein